MKKLFFPLLFVVLICSCSKESEEIKESFLSDITFTYYDRLDKFDLLYQYPSTVDKTKATLVWSISDKSIEINNAIYADAYFYLPESSESKYVDITLTINDGKSTGTVTKEILLPALNEVRKKGLGRALDEEKSNNVDHDWYFDQAISGEHSPVNCGPSVAAMVVKWLYPDFTETPEDARKIIQPTGGGVTLYQLSPYLIKNSVPHVFVYSITDIHFLKEVINYGYIAILGVNMSYISFQENRKWHKGNYYSAPPSGDGWNHFIIVKGYKVVDGIIYYEVYDPYSYQRRYENGQLMGIDRYFQWNELEKAFRAFTSLPTGNDMIIIGYDGS